MQKPKITDEKKKTLENLFLTRRNAAETEFEGKYDKIKTAMEAFMGYMPGDEEHKATNSESMKSGNDPDGAKAGSFSKYLAPISTSLILKWLQDIQTHNFRFEFEGNPDYNTKNSDGTYKTSIGSFIRRGFDNELNRVYSYNNWKLKQAFAYFYGLVTGTMITQTFSRDKKEEIIDPNTGVKEPISVGRSIELKVYSPLNVMVDWNAAPSDISGTAEWCIVKTGEIDPEVANKTYGTNFNVTALPYSGRDGSTILSQLVNDLKEKSGRTNTYTGLAVYEYYNRDGIKYTFIEDVLVDAEYNSNCISGRIPLNICQVFLDPQSPFGTPFNDFIQESVNMVSYAINSTADNIAINNNAPLFYTKGLIEEDLSLGDIQRNKLVPVDPSSITLTGNAAFDINNHFYKMSIPDISQGTMFIFQQAMQFIFNIAGVSSVSLSGYQDKQIRNADVAQMISSASLRNSSMVVMNIENGFINPTCWDIMRIFHVYYDDFPAFKAMGLPKEFLKDLKNVRVVNGSYLPGDQVDLAQKMAYLEQLMTKYPTLFKGVDVMTDLLRAVGFSQPENYYKDPMSLWDENMAARFLAIISEEGGLQNLVQSSMQLVQAAQPGGQANGQV